MTGTFEGVGSLQFSPDNKFAYAYGGVINTDDQDVPVTLLEITTGSEYLIAKIQFGMKHDSGNNMSFGVYLNTIRISGYAIEGGTTDSQLSNYMPIIIPPFTTLKCDGTNNSSSNDIPLTCTLVAKVKGAIQQENLESITDNNKWASK